MARCAAEPTDLPLIDLFCRSSVAYKARFRERLPENFSQAAQRPHLDHLRRLLKVRAGLPIR